MRNTLPDLTQAARLHGGTAATLAAGAALAGMAAFNIARARQAEHENPPVGRFIEVEGVRLHYYERGRGRPLVLLHGNGVTLIDFLLSGFLQRAAEDYRVIAFDRPGFGYSERPRTTLWTAEEQGRLILRALEAMGVDQPIVLGHSWGASVALAMGLIAPERIRSLMLLSGYYFPTERFDAPAFSPPALPIIGDAMRFTIGPVIGRLIWRKLASKAFAPQSVPERFRAYPREMSLRPFQLHAEAAESGLMIPDAMAMQDDYRTLRTPVTLMAGEADQIVSCARQSARLHRELPHSRFVPLRGLGHMLYYFAAKRILQELEGADEPLRTAVPAGSMEPEPTVM